MEREHFTINKISEVDKLHFKLLCIIKDKKSADMFAEVLNFYILKNNIQFSPYAENLEVASKKV